MRRLYIFGSIFILEIFYFILVCIITRTFLFVPFLIFGISFITLWILFFIYRNFKTIGKIISCVIVTIITLTTGFIFTVNSKACDNMFSKYSDPIREKENYTIENYSKVKKGKYNGWLYSPYELETSKMIIYFGDLYEQSETAIRHSKRLESYSINANLLCFNYPGYGTSKQSQTETSFYDMALVSVDYASKVLEVPLENIIVFGYGFGTANAIYASSNRNVGQLILMSPFVEYRNLAVQSMLNIEKSVVFPIFGTGLNSYFVDAKTTFITSTSDVFYTKEKIDRLMEKYEDSVIYEYTDIDHYEYWSNESVLNNIKSVVEQIIVLEN